MAGSKLYMNISAGKHCLPQHIAPLRKVTLGLLNDETEIGSQYRWGQLR